mmetsp:Transcript_123038/g.229946  ORF Transcript_123038/g.229946 Transcript_123038/m.229946 type:complete len:204 (+) Transcript_123038:1133-1744(+)
MSVSVCKDPLPELSHHVCSPHLGAHRLRNSAHTLLYPCREQNAAMPHLWSCWRMIPLEPCCSHENSTEHNPCESRALCVEWANNRGCDSCFSRLVPATSSSFPNPHRALLVQQPEQKQMHPTGRDPVLQPHHQMNRIPEPCKSLRGRTTFFCHRRLHANQFLQAGTATFCHQLLHMNAYVSSIVKNCAGSSVHGRLQNKYLEP